MFCHMAVMFACALYTRGHAHAGHRILDTIYRHCLNFETSRTYPGIPEYFDARGRGMYPYLTGSASWYLYTLLTMAYGIRGALGDLSLHPRLVCGQFDEHDEASVRTLFAGTRLNVVYYNPERRDVGTYRVRSITLDGHEVSFEDVRGTAMIGRAVLDALDAAVEHELRVDLG